MGEKIPDWVFGGLRRSQRGRREEHWHCRGDLAAGVDHFAQAASPLEGAAEHLVEGGELHPGQEADGENVPSLCEI